MIVYAEVECFIYNSHSLKDKRSVIKKIIHKLRHEFNVSVAEIDYQSLWQRTKFGIVTVSNDVTHAEKVMQNIMKTIDQYSEVERTITTIERM